MVENEVAREVVDSAVTVHRALGPGLLESVYERALAYELSTRGRRVVVQKPIPVIYRGQYLEGGFRADLIVDALVLVEVKSTSAIALVHRKQALTYVRLAELRLGLLINFGQAFLKDGIARLVNDL